MNTTRGVRKVSENIFSHGRAVILTEKDKDKYRWSDIPVGSKFIDTTTGIEMVKLQGESDWVPAGLKNDGTLCIAKDSRFGVERFVVKDLVDDLDPRKFNYVKITDDDKELARKGYILFQNDVGELGELDCYGKFASWDAYRKAKLLDDNAPEEKYRNTKKYGFVFNLEDGDYALLRSHLDVMIDGVLLRSGSTGTLLEIDETRFCLFQDDIEAGMEITAKYIQGFRLGHPYPRTFIGDEEPSEKAAEAGDFWLDTDADLEDLDPLGDKLEDDHMIGWGKIRPETRPTSLAGYGIKDNVSYVGHMHDKSEIIGLPDNFKADGGHADTADKASKADVADYANKANFASAAGAASIATSDTAGREITKTYATKDELNEQKKRLDGNEFVKNNTSNRNVAMRVEVENGKEVVNPYIDGQKVSLGGLSSTLVAEPAFGPNHSIWDQTINNCYFRNCGSQKTGFLSINPVFAQGQTYSLDDVLKKLTSYAHSHTEKHDVVNNCNCNCNCGSDHSH